MNEEITNETTITPERLYKKAQKEAERAYQSYSQINVGAAILLEDGSIYKGCNVENCAYGSTMCAERVAVFGAVAKGADMNTAQYIAIAGPEQFGSFTPCGACLQVLSEFNKDVQLIFMWKGELVVKPLAELMPYSWRFSG